jgi:hypothetical protein
VGAVPVCIPQLIEDQSKGLPTMLWDPQFTSGNLNGLSISLMGYPWIRYIFAICSDTCIKNLPHTRCDGAVLQLYTYRKINPSH